MGTSFKDVFFGVLDPAGVFGVNTPLDVDALRFGKKGHDARGFNMGGLADESSGASLNAYDDALGGNQPPPLMGNSSPDWLNIGAANSVDTEERGFGMGGLLSSALPKYVRNAGLDPEMWEKHIPDWLKVGRKGYQSRGFGMGGLLQRPFIGALSPVDMRKHLPDWMQLGRKGYQSRGFGMGGMMKSAVDAGLLVHGLDEDSPAWMQVGTREGYQSRGFNMGGLADELGGAVPQGAEAMGLGAVPGMLEESGGFGPGVSEGMELPESASLKDIADMMSREQVAAIIEEVRMALSGEHPQGEQLLSIVAEMFGPEFIQQISQTFAAVSEQGVSDGMSDSIPASLGNEQIAVSEGEYIVPAREVASLGNGSSDAGGRALDRMIQEIRAAATGSPEAAPPIDPSDFLGGSIG